jgi:hypothetical protein
VAIVAFAIFAGLELWIDRRRSYRRRISKAQADTFGRELRHRAAHGMVAGVDSLIDLIARVFGAVFGVAFFVAGMGLLLVVLSSHP